MRHLLEAFAVLSVMIILTVSFLSTYGKGRAFLRKLIGAIRDKPFEAVFFGLLVWVTVAYGGSKPEPPPIITTKGIRLVEVTQTPEQIAFAWVSEDNRIGPGASYLIQERQGSGWETIDQTTSTNYVLRRFTIQKDRRYRIAVDITPEDENGGI